MIFVCRIQVGIGSLILGRGDAHFEAKSIEPLAHTYRRYDRTVIISGILEAYNSCCQYAPCLLSFHILDCHFDREMRDSKIALNKNLMIPETLLYIYKTVHHCRGIRLTEH